MLILVQFHMTKSRDGSINFKAKDFNFEFQMKETDNEKLMRTLTKATANHIHCHNFSLEQLHGMSVIPGNVTAGTVMIPVRIADILGTKVEKVTITMPKALTERIDAHVFNSSTHASRSSFLADAAVKLLLEEGFNYDSTPTPKGRETKES